MLTRNGNGEEGSVAAENIIRFLKSDSSIFSLGVFELIIRYLIPFFDIFFSDAF